MKRALSLAYLALSLAALASGADRCGQVADCVIDVGRACAKEHLPLRIERAAAAKVVAARNAHDVDRDGCYRETEITDYPDAVWLPAGAHMRGVLPSTLDMYAATYTGVQPSSVSAFTSDRAARSARTIST